MREEAEWTDCGAEGLWGEGSVQGEAQGSGQGRGQWSHLIQNQEEGTGLGNMLRPMGGLGECGRPQKTFLGSGGQEASGPWSEAGAGDRKEGYVSRDGE